MDDKPELCHKTCLGKNKLDPKIEFKKKYNMAEKSKMVDIFLYANIIVI
jgi:hypothetical protein